MVAEQKYEYNKSNLFSSYNVIQLKKKKKKKEKGMNILVIHPLQWKSVYAKIYNSQIKENQLQ